MKHLVRRVKVILGVGGFLAFLALAYGVLSARIEVLPSGVYKRFAIPLGSNSGIAIPVYSGSGRSVSIRGYLDGPVVKALGENRWSVRWYCEKDVFEREVVGDSVEISCGGKAMSFPLREARVPAAIGPMPEKLVVLSDVEGNIAFLSRALKSLSVTDSDGNWSYGKGHLVVLGDSVDRGRDVFAVLWLLYRLSLQAESAGGAVHVVIGNHEQYVLRSNISRADPEHLYSLRRMGGVSAVFADDTLIGRWLRRMPVALRLGRVLFVHGGVSPSVAASGMNVEDLNQGMADYWRTLGSNPVRMPSFDAVLGFEGVTQYRGYLMPVDGQYVRATQDEVAAVASRFEVDSIVVAHTPVERVESLYEGKVYAINVNSDSARSEVLAFEQGIPRVIDIGVPRELAREEDLELIEWRIASASDRKLLLEMYREMRRLSSLPHPY